MDIKQLEHFISVWNSNINIITSPYTEKTHQSLFEFCVKESIKVYKSISLKDILLTVSNKKYTKEIKNYNEFEICLHFNYHIDILKPKTTNKKYIYEGENRNEFDVQIKRNVIIKKESIYSAKVNQLDIDLAIVKNYMVPIKTDNYKPIQNSFEFIFFQLDLYNNSSIRINKWFNLIKNNPKIIQDIDKLKFLAQLYSFFKKYNNLKFNQEKLSFWLENINSDSKFIFFESYIKKDNQKEYAELLIKITRENHLKLLISDFEKKKKNSIDQSDFIQNQIKKTKNILSNKANTIYDFDFSNTQTDNYGIIYEDLVNANREEYYYNVKKSIAAGKTEAMQDFVHYMDSLTIKQKKKNIVSKNTVIENTNLIPIEIFDQTKNYLKKNAIQINICYKHKAYDACFVILRKMTEILIIELYEKEEIESKIQDSNGHYFMLKKLISSFQNEIKFKKLMSRKVKEYLPKIKINGDLSAHNRKYNARQHDVDILRNEFRVVFEELINSIY